MTDPTPENQIDLNVLRELADTVRARKADDAETSYTAKLLRGGVSTCAKKFGEEAVETVIAAVEGNGNNLAQESADLLYHWLVTLEAANVSLGDVMAVLRQRQGLGGLDEKAARTDK